MSRVLGEGDTVVLPSAPFVASPGAPSVASLCEEARPGTLQCDVVVVGTGAGGALAGTTLQKAGFQVIFVEAGGGYAAGDFRRQSLAWSLTHIWSNKGASTSSSRPVAIVPNGQVVGGSTVLNSAICFRPPAKRLAEWRERTGFALFDPGRLDPFVDDIWRRIGVMPTHAGIGRNNNLLFEKGCAALGYDHAWMDRNAPGCIGCGVCHLGCPSSGKASVDKSILPEAVHLGARILTRARATAALIEGGVATGVVCDVLDRDTDHTTGTLTIKADVVIVAGNALHSPLLLQASGIDNPHCGAHLAIHPGIGIFGEFKDPVVMWDGVPQGYYAHCPTDENALLETANAGPAELFSYLGQAGDLDVVQRLGHLAMAGAMIRDVGGGTVALDDDDGVLRPRFTLQFHERDLQAFKNGGKAVARAWFAAGALAVIPGIFPQRRCLTEQQALEHIDTLSDVSMLSQLYGSHPQGTCRIGPVDGEARGVVDEHGAVHGTQNLYVMDGSIFPTTLGVNPQVTIMALSSLLSTSLAERMGAKKT